MGTLVAKLTNQNDEQRGFALFKPTYFLFFTLFAAGLALAEEAVTEGAVEPEAEIEPVYQVEFLVIRPRVRDGLQFEEWSDQRPERSDDELFVGDAPAEQPLEALPLFEWTADDQLDLPNTIERLKANNNYELLLHRSWRQQATPRDNATSYRIKLPFDENNQAQPIPEPIDEGAEAEDGQTAGSNTNSGFSQATFNNDGSFSNGFNTFSTSPIEQEPQPPVAGLVGQVAFSKARYLHFNVDVLMAEYVPKENSGNEWTQNWNGGNAFGTASNGEKSSFGLQPSANAQNRFALAESLGLQPEEAQALTYYTLKETRRIKTEQTHYFDHPAFAVLAHVRRLSDEELLAHQQALAGRVEGAGANF